MSNYKNCNERLKQSLELFHYCLKQNVSLKTGCEHLGLGDSFPRRSRKKLTEAYLNNEISQDDIAMFNYSYDLVINRNQSNLEKNLAKAPKSNINEVNYLSVDWSKDDKYAQPTFIYVGDQVQIEKELVSTVDLEQDEKFDERSKGWAIRDSTDKIIGYGYKILIRDELPLSGTLSREQMERIYSEYPYNTINNVSTEFPTLTVVDLKRILRTFNITKTELFPQHVVEEHSEEKVAQFALKAKAKASLKKFSASQTTFFEKKYQEAQEEIKKLKESKEWIESVISKYINSDSIKSAVEKSEFNFIDLANTNNETRTTFAVISDIHFGKLFPTSKMSFGRGTDKDILRERCLEAAKEFVKEANYNSSNYLHVLNLGDILESVQPSGQHAQHTEEMDLLGNEQLMYAIDVLVEFFDAIYKAFKGNKIVLHGIGGNHDRILPTNQEDKKRTASLLVYKMLHRILTLKYKGFIDVRIYEDGIMSFEQDGLSFIATHGDSPLGKKPAIELINLFKVGNSKNYTVILKGHLHHSKQVDEGPNFVYLQAGSICSADGFTQNQLGLGAQPSVLTITKGRHFGVNYKKTVLY